ncbi:hypothetical protein Taro_032028, partial [Colocasia esculenta]|nr:hypothetical protein [Colocasia esculenta]
FHLFLFALRGAGQGREQRSGLGRLPTVDGGRAPTSWSLLLRGGGVGAPRDVEGARAPVTDRGDCEGERLRAARCVQGEHGEASATERKGARPLGLPRQRAPEVFTANGGYCDKGAVTLGGDCDERKGDSVTAAASQVGGDFGLIGVGVRRQGLVSLLYDSAFVNLPNPLSFTRQAETKAMAAGPSSVPSGSGRGRRSSKAPLVTWDNYSRLSRGHLRIAMAADSSDDEADTMDISRLRLDSNPIFFFRGGDYRADHLKDRHLM